MTAFHKQVFVADILINVRIFRAVQLWLAALRAGSVTLSATSVSPAWEEEYAKAAVSARRGGHANISGADVRFC